MLNSPLTRLPAYLAATLLVLAGCATPPDQPPQASGPCQIIGSTTAPKTTTGSPETPVSSTPRDRATQPEISTGYRSNMTAVRTQNFAAATANPLATQAACEVLRDGGSAMDAAVTAQAVLGLVEPQSSGLGGGGFLLHYDANAGTVTAYDGRETAPAAATPNYLRWISDTNHAEPQPDTRTSGRSIGVPGIVQMLHTAHTEHGHTPWSDLFAPAIQLADNGFDISPRLAASIAEAAPLLRIDNEAAHYFLTTDSTGKPAGTQLTNPAYAKTLSTIATDPDAFYTGAIAHDIAQAAADTSSGRTPSMMTPNDLAAYTIKKRQPLCTPYRNYTICGMPPPSSGGITVAAALGILEHFPMNNYAPIDLDLNGGRPTVMGVHLIAEAERLAYADRDAYIADTDFVALPGGSPETLVNPQYLAERAALISEHHTMGTAQPGQFDIPGAVMPTEEHGTSHISIVDADGNAVSLTTTVESAFGSGHMVDGFILNNQLTDFAANPVGPDGTAVANRLEPGKRPRSSMAPTLIFDQADTGLGPLHAVVGSPGGSVIIQFVIKTIVAIQDWGLDPQQAVSMVDFGAANSPKTNIGGEHPIIDTTHNGDNDPLVTGLRALGHQIDLTQQSSGLSALVRTPSGWIGGADPRREGTVMGD